MKIQLLGLVVSLFVMLDVKFSEAFGEVAHRRCEEIKVPMCKKVGYNMTAMPNQFNHINQAEAENEAAQFQPLLNTNCSSDLLFFLCSLYTPICIPDYNQPLPPCKAVCERVKMGCEPVMKQHGFNWPQSLNCNRVTGQAEQLCMDSNPKSSTTARPVHPTRRPQASRNRERSSPAQLQKHEESNYAHSTITEMDTPIAAASVLKSIMLIVIILPIISQYFSC